MHNRHWVGIGVLLAAVVGVSLPLSASADAQQEKPPATAKQKRAAGPPTPEQIETAKEFALEHHPELAELLTKLETKSKGDFRRGIREVHRAVVRLERFNERQPERYQFELEKWKLDSRIRLMTARWTMSQSPQLEEQIKALLKERKESHVQRLTNERKRVAKRLEQLDKQIANATDSTNIDAEWRRLRKQASSRTGQRRSKKTPEAVTSNFDNE